MNTWLTAAFVLLCALFPCSILLLRGREMDRLIALELSSTIVVMALMLMAEGYGRTIYFDIPLGIAVLSLPAGLVFAHVLERWL